MAGWIGELMDDLRAAQTALDRAAARIAAHRASVDLGIHYPIYSCGHPHRSRGEATACKNAAAEVPHEGVVVT